MTEEAILQLIESDPWMMHILRIAEKQALKDWVIGAGFVRNKVWDHLHGFQNETVPTPDIDLVYYDPEGNGEKEDEILSKKLERETGLPWEVVNEYYAHQWNNIPPYTSALDALSQWPETATGIGVTLQGDTVRLIAPHGIADLVEMVVRKSPKFPGSYAVLLERVSKKKWLEKWPKLRLID